MLSLLAKEYFVVPSVDLYDPNYSKTLFAYSTSQNLSNHNAMKQLKEELPSTATGNKKISYYRWCVSIRVTKTFGPRPEAQSTPFLSSSLITM